MNIHDKFDIFKKSDKDNSQIRGDRVIETCNTEYVQRPVNISLNSRNIFATTKYATVLLESKLTRLKSKTVATKCKIHGKNGIRAVGIPTPCNINRTV